jgi:hypothetical protein
MNLVLGSLLLFVLISPGLLFRFSYLQGTYAKLTFKVSAIEEIFWAVLFSFFLQLSAVLLIEYFSRYDVRVDIVIQMVTGNQNTDFSVVHQSIAGFMLYTLTLLLCSVVLGVTTRQIIRKSKLDLKFPFLRFGNEWHYLLTGEILYLQKGIEKSSITMIQLDVVVNSSEGNIIYTGTLTDFYLSKDNGLDRVYLGNVYRRKLKDDLSPDKHNGGYLARHLDERYYAMPGDLFVVTYDKIINLNITYYIGPDYQLEVVENESDSK